MVAVTDIGLELLTPWPDSCGNYPPITAAEPVQGSVGMAVQMV